MNIDPVMRLEESARELHDTAGMYTKPVLKKYPLLFAFLLTFSAGAIIHGFELFTDDFEIFHTHPSLLMILGIIALMLTGTLYRTLQKLA